MKPAPPEEWHPYYAGKTWLADWLDGTDHAVRIPVMPPISSFLFADEPDVSRLDMREILMTKRKAWAPAPYVGRPFVYVWYVGVDNLGRQIAGRSRITYTDDSRTYETA